VSARTTKVSHQKREAMVSLAADGLSNRQIGERLQTAERTVYDVLRTEDARAEIREAREARVARAKARLEFLADAAIGALGQAIVGSHESKIRLAAADSILDRIGLTRSVKTESVTRHASGGGDGFGSRSEEDLRFFVEFGRWPEET